MKNEINSVHSAQAFRIPPPRHSLPVKETETLKESAGRRKGWRVCVFPGSRSKVENSGGVVALWVDGEDTWVRVHVPYWPLILSLHTADWMLNTLTNTFLLLCSVKLKLIFMKESYFLSLPHRLVWQLPKLTNQWSKHFHFIIQTLYWCAEMINIKPGKVLWDVHKNISGLPCRID